jgi:hypothetical protein
MRPCPRCGSVAPDEAVLCPVCGFVFAPAGLGQTFVGHQAPDAAAAPPGPPAGQAPAGLKGTMIGIAPLGSAGGPPEHTGPPGPAPASAPAAPQGFRGTMIGMAPIAPAAPPQYQSPTQTASMGPMVTKGTLLGMPAVGQQPPGAMPPPDQAGATFPGHQPPGAQPPARGVGPKTILGIARPGIAPLNPGMARPVEPPAPGPAWAPLPSLPPPPPPAADSLGDEFSVLPGHGRNRRIPLIAALVIVAAAALFTAAGVVLFLYRSRGAIQTNVALGADGREELVLSCEGCDDGATVRLESASATFTGRRATLRLARELAVGDNKLPIVLERRPGKTETIELSVPVEFRVRGDTTDLAKTPPAIKIVARAVKGSAVVIDGKAAPLADDGTAALTVDVSRSLTGPDAMPRSLEHHVPYAVTPPGGSPKRGEVVVRIGITPLVLQAPGESIVIDTPTFVLAGRTAKNGVVSVEGRPITVDTAGQFAQVMGVSAEGETTVVVRAVAPDQAPRLIPVRVRRVSSLAAETERVRPQATTSYAAIEKPTEAQRGLFVLLDGAVLEARVENFTTVFLMETKSGCTSPPCLLRVTWGNKGAFGEGDPVSVFGTLSGSVDGPRSGTKIPSVAASFVAKGRP